jgi:hypothetical protein
VGNDAVTHASRQQLVDLTKKYGVLAVYATREFVDAQPRRLGREVVEA